ncbi:MAG TPA: hypothetical protein VMW00_05825 [Dehalococcoidales bacterium]|nr:hypothetical protein [Dehalococcoidales bacterium]
MTLEGTVSLGFNSITTSGFLAAFALALGANNLQIGILAAISFLMQLIQLPAIWLVEKVRRRKAIAVIPILIFTPGRTAIYLLLGLMAFRGLLAAVCNSAWNGWIRDLVPQSILGQIFSRRLASATAAGIVFSLGAALFVDYWRGHVPGESEILGYTYVLLFGTLFLGLASPTFMSLMPEPLMQPIKGQQPPLWQSPHSPLCRVREFLLAVANSY